jgi:hypothetical protein
MRNTVVAALAALAALAVLVPAHAHALVFAGLRAGYALPSGDAREDAPMKDQVSANVPIQLDLGMSALGFMSVGLYASYGPTRLTSEAKDLCGAATCSGANLRAGGQLNLRLPVLDAVWGGVFAGFEQQQLKGGSVDVKLRGWEAGLQAGYDFDVLPFLQVGPFASWSVAQFVTASGGEELGAKANHTALTFGLRGLFDF